MKTRIFTAVEVIGWFVLAGGFYFFIKFIILLRSPEGQLLFGLDNTGLGIMMGALLSLDPGLLLVRIGRALRKRSSASSASHRSQREDPRED